MTEALTVPTAIEAVVQRFDMSPEPFTERDIERSLKEARKGLANPSDAEKLGAWAEVLAFALVPNRQGESPWRTFFGPMGSGETKDGKTVYFPDIDGTPPAAVVHWQNRGRSVTHPLLRARYADLAWDLAPAITKGRRDPDMARIAIDAYLASIPATIRPEVYDRYMAAIRAFDLAGMLRDEPRRMAAKVALLDLHREGMRDRQGNWWIAYDHLMNDRNSGLTDDERNELVGDLETIVSYHSDPAPNKFNPHAAKDAASRLIRFHTSRKQADDVRRLHGAIGRTYEHFASLGDPMLASAVLQTSIDAYANAGMADDSRRLRTTMEQKIGEARAQMAPITSEVKITKDDIDKFIDAVVVGDLGQSFANIATEFLPRRADLERQVKETLDQAPLMAHLTQTIMADDHIAAVIGSVEDDPFGRLLQQMEFTLSISRVWLREAFDRLFSKHNVAPEHFVGWANRHGLFEDVSLLLEGVRGWLEGDTAKAVHILVPQVERALRSIAVQLGRPATKPHPAVKGASVAIGMGDILYSGDVSEALGPDLTLYFQALYADPRGVNLRNEVAHGLLPSSSISDHLLRLTIHSLLILGLWKELAKSRR